MLMPWIMSRRQYLLLCLSLVAVPGSARAQAQPTSVDLPSITDDKGDIYDFTFEQNDKNKSEWTLKLKKKKKDAKADQPPEAGQLNGFIDAIMTTTPDEKKKEVVTEVKNKGKAGYLFQVTCPKDEKEAPSIGYNIGSATTLKIGGAPAEAHKKQDEIIAKLKSMKLPNK
jgi:hypothetical protein